MKESKNTVIVGAGLVGSLWACFLAKQGYRVDVYERRSDLRDIEMDAGKSINLALSDRGLKALSKVGLDKETLKLCIPAYGRLMHDVDGNTTFQAYGKEDQAINSISRGELNALLMDAADEYSNVQFYFNHKCDRVSYNTGKLHITNLKSNKQIELQPDLIFGTDGAFSKVRYSLQKTDRFDYQQMFLKHGYKEVLMPAAENGGWRIEKERLHIWPRESFMFMALPNLDGSFTCTLFLPFEGERSFAQLKSDEDVLAFFNTEFPDVISHLPNLLEEYNSNPTSSLAIIRCFPWSNNNVMLLGDAAHAIVPFYGQGMNAGFEDCTILNELMLNEENWQDAFSKFETMRKPDAEAIADLALQNFVEMRDLVADDEFLLRKKIEKKLMRQFPDQFIAQYSMVTFTHIPYHKALDLGKSQKILLNELAEIPGIIENWDQDGIQEKIKFAFKNYLG